jgi:hypothetical protein
MGLNWNEINSIGMIFSKNSCTSDAERMVFLFELNPSITSLRTPAKPGKAKRQTKATA